MAEREGLSHDDVAVAEVIIIVQVRPAQSRRPDGHLDVAVAQRWECPLLLQPRVSVKGGEHIERRQLTRRSSRAPWRTDARTFSAAIASLGFSRRRESSPG